MRRPVLFGALLFVGAVGLGYRGYRGPVGEVEATEVAEFPSLEPSRWANGAPVSLAAAKGEVVFVEGWSPG